MSSARWYVVQTQPHAEAKANEHLRRQGFITYLPKFIKSRRHARKTEKVSRPLFPRYMFVLIDNSYQAWHVIRSTRGVANLIGGPNGPTAVRDDVIRALRQREGNDGHFHFDAPKFIRGATVQILDGVFASCVGLYESMNDKDRITVLLNLLGGRVRVVLEAQSVVAA